MRIPDKYAFWRWPAKIRALTTELEQLKEQHARVVAGQSKLLEWVKVTHRLASPAQGIRALLQNGKRLVPLLLFLLAASSGWTQPAPPILRNPMTTNSHFGPTPTEGQVPIWNATVKKWSNNIVSSGASTPHIWTNDNGTLNPIDFPTNILLRVNVPDDGIGTNFYFDSRVYRTNQTSKLFTIRNGGSNALTIGPNGQLMAGRNNGTPIPGAVLYGIFDTALGETNQQEIFTLSGNSAVGYSGAADLIIDTNYGALLLFANKEGGTKFTRFAVQAGAGDNPQNFNSFTMQALVDGATYMQMDPNFTLLTPTNYLFSSSIRITNTHTLMSLQNSNFPVFEVDGVGDLRLLKKIPYQWPSSQGAAGTALTNNGSGILGWGPVASSGPGFGDLVWTNDVGRIYTLVDQPRIVFTTNRIFGRLIRADGTNTALGSNALGAFLGSGADKNTAIGTEALSVSEGAEDTAVGHHAAKNIDNGAFNTAIGSGALEANQFRSDNTAVGYNALNIFVTGFENTSIGSSTMDLVTDSYYGTALGWGALDKLSGLGNTALGHSALLNAQGGGSYNLAIGFEAMHSSDRPEGVVAIGRGAFDGIDDLTNVVALGYQATSLAGFLTNSVALGANTRITTNNQMMFGTNVTRYVFRNIEYFFPSAQGSAGTALTNDGTGVLGWGVLLFQPASANLTNWSNIPTGAMANVVSTDFLTNWANAISNLTQTKQFGTLTLSNLSGTGAITNLFSPTLSNASIKPLVVGIGNAAGATNTTGQIRGLEAGSNITLSENGSNIVVASTASGTVAFSDLVWTNDTVAIKPNAFPTNVILRVDVPDDGVGTNYYWDSRTYRASAASKLFALYNGGSNALTVGPFGGIFIGRKNANPIAGPILSGSYDTAIGEPFFQRIDWKARNTTVGYFGSASFIAQTNSSAFSANASDNAGHTAGYGITVRFTNATFNLSANDGSGGGDIGVNLSPGIGSTKPTNYLFSSFFELTNIHTLFSLQNSNTPVFEVDGIGDLKLLKRVSYSWPTSQGSQGTALTNDGSGNLGWGFFQPANANLTNLAGTGAVTNLFTASLSNASIKPIVFGGVGNAAGMTNTTGQLYGLEAGANVTLTPNGSNITVAANNATANGATTNVNQFGAAVPLTIKDGAWFTNIIAFPTGSGTAPSLTVTNIPGIGTNTFQVLNTNGQAVIFAATNNGMTLVASNVNFLGPQTNTSMLNVLGGVTNWGAVETRGNATNAGWLAIAGGFTNINGMLTGGSITNAGRMDTAGGVTNWIGAESKGTFYASSNLLVKAGQGASNAWVGGILYRTIKTTAFTNLNSTVTTFTNAAQCIIPGNTLTNDNDTVVTEWTGTCLAGTNNIRMIYGYQTVLDTGLFTNLVTSWRGGMTISRTAGVGGHADAWVAFSGVAPVSAGTFALSGYSTNLELTCTNGVDVTNGIQLASRRNGGISNNTMVVRWEPAPR